MLRFPCPSCAAPLSAPEEAAGRATHCTTCRQPVTVPALPRPVSASLGAWVVLIIAAALTLVVGLTSLTRYADSNGTPNLYGLVAQCRDLVLSCLVVLSGYVICRAIDRLCR